MPDNQHTLWGIHGGKTGDADALFRNHNVIAIGWPQMGDLAAITPDREAFKTKVAATYPGKKPGAIPNIAGQLFRFVHEVQIGDLAIYPSKRDKHVHVGRITGEYCYDPASERAYPNQRAVKWLGEFPRTRFSQGALYEIGSAMSFFQVKNYADEFVEAVEGKSPVEPGDDGTDETVAPVAEEIEQITQDFVLKQLAKELKGHPFAQFVAHLLEAMGYRTRVSPPGPDRGIDIVAHKDELGFEPPLIKVQVKAVEGTVGDPVASALYGKVGPDEFGLLVTLGTYSNQAKQFGESKSNLRLIDGEELVELILEHYENLDSRYKGLIPLKQVYIPEALTQDSEG